MDKKEQIIKTAIKLFVKQGFENTPTSQISKEANVATGTLFHHFKTKEELINTAYLYGKIKLIEETSPHYKGGKVKEKMKNAWIAKMDWCLAHQDLVNFMNLFSNSIYITTLTREQGKATFEPFTEIISEGVKQGLFKDIPQALLLQTYYGVAHAFFCQIRQEKKVDKKLILTGFNAAWDALAK